MKKFLQNKKLAAIVICCLAVAVVVIAAARSHSGGSEPETTEPTSEATAAADDVIVVTPDGEGVTLSDSGLVTDKDTITPDEKIETTTKKTASKTDAGITAATPVTPAENEDSNASGIVIVGDDDVNDYSCGVKGHHCDSLETHNFITSLEEKGCPICGSHSCKSFYAVDEWGNACYDITKCPEYTQEKDPCIYCQTCGKKVGDGDNGTCVRFTVDCTCPICGKTVKAKTCHTH